MNWGDRRRFPAFPWNTPYIWGFWPSSFSNLLQSILHAAVLLSSPSRSSYVPSHSSSLKSFGVAWDVMCLLFLHLSCTDCCEFPKSLRASPARRMLVCGCCGTELSRVTGKDVLFAFMLLSVQGAFHSYIQETNRNI